MHSEKYSFSDVSKIIPASAGREIEYYKRNFGLTSPEVTSLEPFDLNQRKVGIGVGERDIGCDS